MTTRIPSDTDFFVDVPQVGRFRYGRRTFGDRIRIRAEYMRLSGGFAEQDLDLSVMSAVVSEHIVLCVKAPPGYEDLEKIDTTADPEAVDANLIKLYNAVKEKEDSFRLAPRADAKGEGSGTGDGADDRAVVPPAVPSLSA